MIVSGFGSGIRVSRMKAAVAIKIMGNGVWMRDCGISSFLFLSVAAIRLVSERNKAVAMTVQA